ISKVRHIACVAPNNQTEGQRLFHAPANAVGKVHPRRVTPAVEFMGKAQAPRKVRPPLVLISKKHIKGAKLILVHGRIVGLRIRSARSWLQAVGSQIAIPEELKLRVGSERISDERP